MYKAKRLNTQEYVQGTLVMDTGFCYIFQGIKEHIKRDDYVCTLVTVDPYSIVKVSRDKDQ